MSEEVKNITEESVIPVRQRWMCECGGEMKSTGQAITQIYTSYDHCCDKCGRDEWADHSYPRIVFKDAQAS